MDYGKYKFELEKHGKPGKKQHTADVKEVKMRYKIEEHDYQVRINQAEILKDGDKVNCDVPSGDSTQRLSRDSAQADGNGSRKLGSAATEKEGKNMMMDIPEEISWGAGEWEESSQSLLSTP